jgi:hypothetical protein
LDTYDFIIIKRVVVVVASRAVGLNSFVDL